ncbi:PCD16 protein, partial [Bucco capensis]|nr:PCD16 protein [Bucco capensis]
LDRERAETHRLVVEAWDGGSPRLRGRLQVSVRVLDENDNAPTFSRAEYQARLREDAPPGTTVCRLRATDPDLGANGEVSYAINRRQSDPDGYFEVEERSGVLRLRRPLDREARALHRVVVEARDGGAQPEVSSALVSVAVLDVNDNRPAIRLLYLTESGGPRVSEGTRPGDYVARVSVSDADEDGGVEGSGISLALLGGDGAFALRPGGSGIFFLCVAGPLDRESRDLYELRLVATDGGAPPLSAEEQLLLRVADVNDEAPVFPQSHYRAAVSEAATPGTAVLRVSASDADEPGSPNAEVRYALEGEPASLALLRIDARSGAVSTRAHLDRERQAALELRVVARDDGIPPRTATCRLSVRVEDANDNEPRFERQVYRRRLPEHAAPGRCLLQVRAAASSREGSLEVVSYRISSGDPYGKFSIDPQFGIIRTKKQLDHETQSVVVLTVQSQLGNSSIYSSTQVNISVIDINDNPPVFLTKSGKVTISHTQPPGTAVYIAHAEDKDSGLNGAVVYSIASKQSNAFSIDPSLGMVNLTRTVFADKQQEYTLQIRAEDCGNPPLTSLLMLTVIIEEQKMGPTLVFQNLVYQVEISEATSPGAQILQVQAHSLDPHSVMSKLMYSLEPSTDSVEFGISSDTGWIYLRKRLNYERAQILSFKALVTTSRDENLRQNASASVIVNVLDENDNSPMFTCESYFFEMEENPFPRGVVGTVTAVDKDSGRNGQLSYFLLSDGKYFKMNPNTGSI